MPTGLVLAHLSDIHFRKQVGGGDAWDLDADLRNEMELDLERVRREIGSIQGLLISGDIAFSGASEEYEDAARWLTKITGIAGCRETDVWMVPGNHDVERRHITESRTIQDFHALMRDCDSTEIDRLLYDYLASDKSGGDAYLTPLESYNAFASRYECSVSARQPWWDSQMDIGDSGFRLRIRGITSPLISDGYDNRDANRMVVGQAQVNIRREPGSMVMTLSHHPPSWLRDGVTIEDHLRTRAQIQLWGHGHTQRARPMDGNLHLFAGAVHPERGELDWEPRYNVMKIEVGSESAASVTLFARVWRQQGGRFAADFDPSGSESTVFPIPVEPHGEIRTEELEIVAEPAASERPQRDARRQLAFHFSSLAYQRRLAIARELDLLDPSTRGVGDRELFEIVLGLAVGSGKLAELWSAVHRERGIPETTNPFVEASADRGMGSSNG